MENHEKEIAKKSREIRKEKNESCELELEKIENNEWIVSVRIGLITFSHCIWFFDNFNPNKNDFLNYMKNVFNEEIYQIIDKNNNQLDKYVIN